MITLSNIVKVKFYNNKTCFCQNDKLNLKRNLTVVVKTPRGLEFGIITDLEPDYYIQEDLDDYKIIRISTKKDYQQHLSNQKEEKNALNLCQELSKKNKLNIQILDANFTLDRSQLMFRFISDTRIDFRELAKDLAYEYRTRIELRQIGIRDKAKEIGGIGQCGKKLCCASFLKDLNSVSISMAKNQNISLNPNKINGCCGRLLCCLNYEDEMYSECKKNLPNVGDNVKTSNGEGTVISVNVLQQTYKVDYGKTGVLEEEAK